MSDLLIGVDAGTSVIKAVAFDTEGRQVALASLPNTYEALPGGGVEQDMARTWADTAAVLRALGEKIEGLPARARALAITGQGDGTWLIDRDGLPIHNAWLWLDARAAACAREIAASEVMATIYAQTATGLNVCQMRTQLAWMKRHAPDLLARAATALHCKDWLYFRLTGVRASDPTEGVFTFGDYRARTYSDAVLDALDLTDLKALLPPLLDGTRETHPLSPEAARATGLPEGLPVCLASVDIMCSALGAGLYDADVQPGLTVLGSTGMHMRFVPDAEAVVLNETQSGYTMAFPGPAYAQMQTNMAATLNIDWVLDLAREVLATEGVARTRADLIAGLDERVLGARSGGVLYHPYISTAGERGPFAEPAARASFTGLDQGVGWAGLVRAVYDGLALAARDCYAAMGPMPSEVRLTGGAARSRALRRILAGALGVPVRTIERAESGAAGAVMQAAIALGHYPDAATAARAWVDPLLHAAEPPDPGLIPHYDALFESYRHTRTALAPAWHAQAETRRRLAEGSPS